jgi:ribonuclease HI/pterin-4a-carbinolamine dehydratase
MWKETKNGLHRSFVFDDFAQAFEFMSRVAVLAESRDHHPTWKNAYNKVEIWLSTHDADGAVTEKDRGLAEAIDDELAEMQSPADETTPEPPKVSRPTHVKLYADGGSRGNPGPSATGYVVLDEQDHILHQSGAYLGITTNNQAEYRALKDGLEQALSMGARHVDVYLDSLLVINQMKGIFKVKNRELWPVHDAIKELAAKFQKVTYTHVPREYNKLADAEVNKVLDAQNGA